MRALNALMDLVREPEPASPASPSNGARIVAPDGRTLPLESAQIRAEAKGGIARVILTQRFTNAHEEPLSVTYLLPLPSDAAVSGFSFRIGDRRVTGEVDKRARARERFEQAIVEGRTAAILEQERSSLFTQEVGNIPPKTAVDVEIELDQRLRWLADGAWEWRFPTVCGPRYMNDRVVDAERIVVDLSTEPLRARFGAEIVIGDPNERVDSPSHALSLDGGRATTDGGLDRDVVVRWRVATPQIGLSIAAARPAAQDGVYALLTIVPPSEKTAAVARDLIFLIDASGSMHGAPLDQAKRIAAAMIDTLGPEDRIELISFGSVPERFNTEPLAATKDGKRAALAWLRKVQASGGTEMSRAVIEALRPLKEGCQRQVVLMTDGYIGFERELVRDVLERLPRGARLHTVGVGSAVNRTLTQWAARAGNGVEVIVGLTEDPERAAARLLARTTLPIVTDVTLEGVKQTAPLRVPDLYAGSPSLVSLALDPDAREVFVRGRTSKGNAWEARVDVPRLALGEGLPAVTTLFGRERVEDLETAIAARGDADADAEIERIGLTFRIATRHTSWVAITEDATVDPDAEKRNVRQPHEVPHGTSIEGLGLRAPAAIARKSGKESDVLFNLKELSNLEEERTRTGERQAKMTRTGTLAPELYEGARGGSTGGPPAVRAPAQAIAPAPMAPAPMGAPPAMRRPASIPESAPRPTLASPAIGPAKSSPSRAWMWIALVIAILVGALIAWLVYSAYLAPAPPRPAPAEAREEEDPTRRE
jgi:Ca-activated chloride channel family protein